jgi:F420-non-reducing hydrogenase small subunit
MSDTAATPSGEKVALNLEWLSDCGGCHVAVIDLHEKILDVLEAVEIQHCPVLSDVKSCPPAKVGLVSGAIRSEHDRHMAEQMRASCDIIVALGTCAAYGGIPGAGAAHSRGEMLAAVYQRNRTTAAAPPPNVESAALEKMVAPLDEAIPVDYYLPGCPPHPKFIFNALRALVEGRPPVQESENVCGRCNRVMRKTSVTSLRNLHETADTPDTCFLSQGVLCMGSVTLDRCLAPCPSSGMICTGCAGPSLQILTEPNRDLRTEVADRISRLTQIDKSAVVSAIEQSAKSHYSYAMASPMIGGKPTFHIHQWIRNTEEIE